MNTEQSFLLVPYGNHTYSFATDSQPSHVWTTISSDGIQVCGNDSDPDYVQVVVGSYGFALNCHITSDSAQIGWFVETTTTTNANDSQ